MKYLIKRLFFLLSLSLTIIFLIKPNLLAASLRNYNMYLAMLCIIGICFGFIYGIGYTPNSKFLRFIMSPVVILILIIIPLIILNINTFRV